MVITPSTANPAPAATGLFARLAADLAALKAGTPLTELPAGAVCTAGAPKLTADEQTALSARLRGHLSDIIADRGYTAKNADTFTLPLRALGANVIAELHPQQAGQRGTQQGALVLDAVLHCPGTPEPLRSSLDRSSKRPPATGPPTRLDSANANRSRSASSAPKTSTAGNASSARPRPAKSSAPCTHPASP
jgi:hypothetical protein